MKARTEETLSTQNVSQSFSLAALAAASLGASTLCSTSCAVGAAPAGFLRATTLGLAGVEAACGGDALCFAAGSGRAALPACKLACSPTLKTEITCDRR